MEDSGHRSCQHHGFEDLKKWSHILAERTAYTVTGKERETGRQESVVEPRFLRNQEVRNPVLIKLH
jgi:hypothetical protein